LEKTLHSRAERKTVGSFKSISWWFKFSFYHLVVRKDSVMPSKDCVEQKKVNRFNYWIGGVALVMATLLILGNS